MEEAWKPLTEHCIESYIFVVRWWHIREIIGWVRVKVQQPVNPMTSRSHGSREPQMTLAQEEGEGCVITNGTYNS